MYPVSAAFHSAIQAGAPQKALLMFADAVFTDTDIAARGGLMFSEPFCSQTDLTIGLCPSATLTASILNPDGVLTGFTFGEFTGYLGVRTGGGMYQPTSGANATLPINGDNVVSVHSSAPYVRVGGIGVTDQPSFVPQAIISYETSVYVVSAAGEFYRYTYTGSQTWGDLSTLQWRDISGRTWADIAAETWDDVAASQWQEYENKGVRWSDYTPTIAAGEAVTVNAFMTAKGAYWAAEHTAAAFAGNILKVYEADGSYDTYEMCPLGVFNADKPLTQRKSVVKFTAYDRMGLLDKDVTAWWAGLTFPLTLGQIFASLCTYVGVTPTTTTFLNSTHSYTTAPFASNTLTGRAMLKYIAEAACAIARFTRAGELELAWFGTILYTSPEAGIVTGGITLAEYEVAAIDKLQTQAETTDLGVVIGTGSNAYVLLASPLIVGETDAEIRAFATPIYTRLTAFAAFTPINAKVKSDWSLQSGDIIDIIYEGNTYSLPIYTQSVAWAGDGRSTLASTGSALRDATTVTNRETFTANQKMTLIEKSVDGISITLTSKVGEDEIIGKINLSAEEAKIAFGKLTLEGYTTINNNFKVLLDGSIEAVNGKFGGTLTGVSGVFTSLRAIYDEDTGQAIYLEERTIGGEAYAGMFFLASNDAYMAFDTYGVVRLKNTNSGFKFASDTPVDMDGGATANGVTIPKIARGIVTVSSSSAATIDYSGWNFANVPQVVVSYATTGSNTAGDWGALKVYSKTTSGCYVIAGGSAPSTTQPVDWIAIGL